MKEFLNILEIKDFHHTNIGNYLEFGITHPHRKKLFEINTGLRQIMWER